MKEKKMSIVIATTTFYLSTDELRFKLACKLARKAKNAGLPIVIVDDSSDPKISKTLKMLGAVVYKQTEWGMGVARRQVLRVIIQKHLPDKAEKSAILWTEPEKYDIVRLAKAICRPIFNFKADVSIMKRSPKSLKSYPKFQIDSEMAANKVYSKVTGRKGYDPMSGPVAFRASILNQFLNWLPGRYGIPDTYVQHWWPFFLPDNRVASVEVNFKYPKRQKLAEETTDNKKIREQREFQKQTVCNAYINLLKLLS